MFGKALGAASPEARPPTPGPCSSGGRSGGEAGFCGNALRAARPVFGCGLLRAFRVFVCRCSARRYRRAGGIRLFLHACVRRALTWLSPSLGWPRCCVVFCADCSLWPSGVQLADFARRSLCVFGASRGLRTRIRCDCAFGFFLVACFGRAKAPRCSRCGCLLAILHFVALSSRFSCIVSCGISYCLRA